MAEYNIRKIDSNEDDGSLAFLKIPRDERSRSFNCDETTQSKLVNTQFWVVDFLEDVQTRFSKAKGKSSVIGHFFAPHGEYRENN